MQGLKSIIDRCKIHRGMLRIAEEMEKPKSLYAGHMDMNREGDCWKEWGVLSRRVQRGKIGITVIT